MDTAWEPGLLAAVQMPFVDEQVGAVGIHTDPGRWAGPLPPPSARCCSGDQTPDALPTLSGLEERARSYARDSRAQRRRERGRAESVTETAPLAF